VFLTGEPGSGKTHTVNRYIELMRRQRVGVAFTASTGIAATHDQVAVMALNLTPSAVSAAVRTLEVEHGVEMFDRIGRGIALTEVGRLFLTEARAVLHRVVSAELALSVRAAVEDGAGAAMVSELVARPRIEAGRLRKLPLPPTTRAFSVLRHDKRYLSKAARAMLDLLSAS
jgi:DNA-binding transcriptional LysR family regulator